MNDFAYFKRRLTSIGYSFIFLANKIIDSFVLSTLKIESQIKLTIVGSSFANGSKNSIASLIRRFLVKYSITEKIKNEFPFFALSWFSPNLLLYPFSCSYFATKRKSLHYSLVSISWMIHSTGAYIGLNDLIMELM